VKKIPVFEIQSRAFTSSRDGIHIQHVISLARSACCPSKSGIKVSYVQTVNL